MTGLVRKATLLTACGLLVAAAAMANVPCPSCSTVPGCISLVGSAAGIPDSLTGKFCVVVRDLANNPLNGSSVTIDLSNAGDLHLCSDQLNVNYIINCAAKTVRQFTDVTGTVCFTLLGGSNGSGNATSLGGGGRIFADGVLIGSPGVSAFDLDGASGVGANDLSAFLTDLGSGSAFERSDYDCSNSVGANDLSILLTVLGNGASSTSCTGTCP